jgi:hypothetical protein
MAAFNAHPHENAGMKPYRLFAAAGTHSVWELSPVVTTPESEGNKKIRRPMLIFFRQPVSPWGKQTSFRGEADTTEFPVELISNHIAA